MKTDYDVIIIGAGPAGASCAKHLVDNGVKTLVIEKCKLPRHKLCGGILTPRAIKEINKYFGDFPENIICENKHVKTQFSKRGTGFIEIPLFDWLNIIRGKLDFWLIQSSGAKISEQTYLLNFYFEKGVYHLNILKDNKSYEILCKYIIGADGGYSKVRRVIDKNYLPSNMIVFKQVIYEGNINLPDNKYSYISSKKYSDLFSCISIKNKNIHIATSFFLNKKKDYHSIVINMLQEKFSMNIISKIRKEYCISELPKNESLNLNFGKNNILLIGEACGLMTKIGEGISSALISGRIAANCIIETFCTNEDVSIIYKNNIQNEKKYVLNTHKSLNNY